MSKLALHLSYWFLIFGLWLATDKASIRQIRLALQSMGEKVKGGVQ